MFQLLASEFSWSVGSIAFECEAETSWPEHVIKEATYLRSRPEAKTETGKRKGTPPALVTIGCQLDTVQGYLRGDSSIEELPRTAWPMGVSVKDGLDYCKWHHSLGRWSLAV